MVEYVGGVNYGNHEKILLEIKKLMRDNAKEEIFLTVTSHGGPSGIGMSFYDTIRHVLKPNLITIGAGDVDSSGIIIFLSAERRLVTRHTTLLLHLAGRTFDSGKRYTANDMAVMVEEDRLKDEQYVSIVAERSNGKLSKKKVFELMERGTILSPELLVSYGLADGILG